MYQNVSYKIQIPTFLTQLEALSTLGSLTRMASLGWRWIEAASVRQDLGPVVLYRLYCSPLRIRWLHTFLLPARSCEHYTFLTSDLNYGLPEGKDLHLFFHLCA